MAAHIDIQLSKTHACAHGTDVGHRYHSSIVQEELAWAHCWVRASPEGAM